MVPSDPIPSLAHHGHATVLSIAFRSAVRIVCLLPGSRLAATASTLSDAPQLIFPKLNRSLVTAFPSPATAPAFTDSIPGSKVPACYFAFSPAGFDARSASRLRCRNWFAPIPAASTLQARCISARKLHPAALPISTPLREFSLPRDQRVQWASPPDGPPSESARSPLAPRSRFYF